MAALSLAISTTQAATLTWDASSTAGIQSAAGTWDGTVSNWTTDSGATNVSWTDGNAASFVGASSANYTVTLATPVTATDLTFTNSGAGVISLSGSNLTFGGSLNVSSASNVSITGTLAGSGSVTTSGTVQFAYNNSFTGGVTISGGKLISGISGATVGTPFGTGTLTINGGTIAANSTNRAINIANSIVIGGDFTVGYPASTAPYVWSGPVSLGSGNYSLASIGQNLTFSGAISGAGGINLTGPSYVVLSNANSNFAGGLTLNPNTPVSINTSSTVVSGVVTKGPIGTGTMTINGGTFSWGAGNITLANNITVNDNFSMVGRTGANSGALTGTMALGASTRTISPFGNINFNNVITGAGGLTWSGSGAVVSIGGATSNAYTGLTTVALTGVGNSLALNKTGNATAIKGDLLLTSGTVLMGSSATVNQIAPTSTVTINGGYVGLYKGVATTGISQQLSKLVYNSGVGALNLGTSGTSKLVLGSGVGTNGGIAVTTSGTLAGNGTLGVSVYGKAGGTIAPGNAGGNLATGALTFANAATGLDLSAVTGGASTIAVNFSLASGTNGVSDKLAITTGVLTGAGGTGGIIINLANLGLDITAGSHQTISLMDWSSAASASGVELADFALGTFSLDTASVTISNVALAFNGTNNGLDVSFDLAAVPEPGSIGLVVLGGLAVLALRMRRRV